MIEHRLPLRSPRQAGSLLYSQNSLPFVQCRAMGKARGSRSTIQTQSNQEGGKDEGTIDFT